MPDYISAIITIPAIFWVAWLIIKDDLNRRKEIKEEMAWIDFRELVNPDNSLKACPNCGKYCIDKLISEEIKFVRYTLICRKCKHVFVQRRVHFILRGFQHMNPEEYDSWHRNIVSERRTEKEEDF